MMGYWLCNNQSLHSVISIYLLSALLLFHLDFTSLMRRVIGPYIVLNNKESAEILLRGVGRDFLPLEK